jgi:hypothetical protein
MDANRFDTLARAVGAQTGRRGLLKTAAVGSLGLLGLTTGLDEALAKKKNKNKCKNNGECKNDQICKNKKCKNVQCKNSGDCGKNKKCKNNKCKKKNNN